MVELSGRATVPQIFFNEVHIGGADDLFQLKNDNKLDDMLAVVRENAADKDDTRVPRIPDKKPEGSMEGVTEGVGGMDLGIRCERDEDAEIVKKMKDPEAGIDVSDRRYHLRKYKQCFVGKDVVDWFVFQKIADDRQKAVEIGQRLLEAHFFHHVTHDHGFEDEKLFYRFIDDEDSHALNVSTISECQPRPATEVAEALRKRILKIYDEFLSPDGRGVDYKGIGKSEAFRKYVEETAELQRCDVLSLTRNEKIAFFINVYNALVIHANVVNGFPANSWQRWKFFNRMAYVIGGYNYSLQDIENGVLRANKKGPFALRRQIPSSDPRIGVVLATPEPRIHFALVCGAKSCPPIKTYSAEVVDDQLSGATEAFFEDDSNLKIDRDAKEIWLSKIISWYKSDFGFTDVQVLSYICSFLRGPRRKMMLDVLDDGKSFKLKYFPYDWSANSQH